MDIHNLLYGYPYIWHICGYPHSNCGSLQLFMDIHNCIYGYPQVELRYRWISTNTLWRFTNLDNNGYPHIQLWISIVGCMDLHNVNCGYPQIYLWRSTIMKNHGYPQMHLWITTIAFWISTNRIVNINNYKCRYPQIQLGISTNDFGISKNDYMDIHE